MVKIGQRSDNVGIVTMNAMRNYERPEFLQVFASIRNFSDQPMTVDATLYFDGEHMDVQTVDLAPGIAPSSEDEPNEPTDEDSVAPPGIDGIRRV